MKVLIAKVFHVKTVVNSPATRNIFFIFLERITVYIHVFQQWGNVSVENDKNPQIDEFLEHLEMFITNLLSAVNNMEGQVTLAENGIGPQIDGLSSPTDFQAAGELSMS